MTRPPFPAFSPDEMLVMAKTIYGEARGEDRQGQRAVAHVILNRFKAQPKYGSGLAGVCLKAGAFSGWNEDDPNLPRVRRITWSNALVLRVCTISAFEAFDEYDFTQGSTHYYVNGTDAPKWAFGHAPIYSHGRHLFFNDIK